MNDQKPMSPAELETLAAKVEEHGEFLKATGQRLDFDWPGALTRVCRQAVGQLAEMERLRQYVTALRTIYEVRTKQYRAALQGTVRDTKRESEFIAAANDLERAAKALEEESPC